MNTSFNNLKSRRANIKKKKKKEILVLKKKKDLIQKKRKSQFNIIESSAFLKSLSIKRKQQMLECGLANETEKKLLLFLIKNHNIIQNNPTFQSTFEISTILNKLIIKVYKLEPKISNVAQEQIEDTALFLFIKEQNHDVTNISSSVQIKATDLFDKCSFFTPGEGMSRRQYKK